MHPATNKRFAIIKECHCRRRACPAPTKIPDKPERIKINDSQLSENDPEGVKPPYNKQLPIIHNPVGVEFIKKTLYAQGMPCVYEDSRVNPNASKQNTEPIFACEEPTATH